MYVYTYPFGVQSSPHKAALRHGRAGCHWLSCALGAGCGPPCPVRSAAASRGRVCARYTMALLPRPAALRLALALALALPLGCAAAAAAAPAPAPVANPPVVADPPRWGWGSLGDMAFLHAGDPQPYTAPELALVKRFSMVQFDKKQGLATMPNASTEDRIIAAARFIKQANPSATTLMYINGLINFPASRLHAVLHADPSLTLRNTQGRQVNLVGNSGVYDVRNPKMRAAFVANALHGMASGAIDGVFIDRANWCEQCTDGRGWVRTNVKDSPRFSDSKNTLIFAQTSSGQTYFCKEAAMFLFSGG